MYPEYGKGHSQTGTGWMVRADSVLFFVHIAMGNSQEEEEASSSLCTVRVCLQLYMRVQSYCHSMFPAAPKKILPTASFPAGGREGKVEEEKKE